MKTIKGYFDIRTRSRFSGADVTNVDFTKLIWLPQWVALLLGVIVQPFFATYQKTGHWQLTGGWGWLAAAFIIAFVIFPAVYRNSFDATKPWLVQIIPLFTAGLGWNSLFTSTVVAVSGKPT